LSSSTLPITPTEAPSRHQRSGLALPARDLKRNTPSCMTRESIAIVCFAVPRPYSAFRPSEFLIRMGCNTPSERITWRLDSKSNQYSGGERELAACDCILNRHCGLREGCRHNLVHVCTSTMIYVTGTTSASQGLEWNGWVPKAKSSKSRVASSVINHEEHDEPGCCTSATRPNLMLKGHILHLRNVALSLPTALKDRESVTKGQVKIRLETVTVRQT